MTYITFNKRKTFADPYILFHHKWVKNLSKNDIASFPKGYWRNKVSKQTFSIWSGYAFEMVIMTNIKLYLKARGLEGVFSGVYHWSHIAKNSEEQGVQIDLVVNYRNDMYDIVECKYYNDEYVISKEYAKRLKNKLVMFRKYGLNAKQRAELRLVFMTSYGVKVNDSSLFEYW